MTLADSNDIRSEAHRIIDGLPSNATWDDLMDRIFVRQRVDAGLADAKAGRVVDVEEVRRRFGLST